MAGTKLNDYAIGDENIESMQLTLDRTFQQQEALSLTEMSTTTVPAIAAGSVAENNGSLYKFDSDEVISTTDPVTTAAVADGTVYICLIPSGSTITAAFTATAPTFSSAKQGWYGTGGQANYKYIEFICEKTGTSYDKKQEIGKSIRRFLGNIVFSGVVSGGTSRTSNNYYTLVYDSEMTDLYDINNSSTGTITIPEKGLYHILGHLSVNVSTVTLGTNNWLDATAEVRCRDIGLTTTYFSEATEAHGPSTISNLVGCRTVFQGDVRFAEGDQLFLEYRWRVTNSSGSSINFSYNEPGTVSSNYINITKIAE